MIKTLLIILILLLAFFMAFIPHIGYAYPLHLDEWIHLTYANSVIDSGSLIFPDPFTGLKVMGPGTNLELTYHALLAMLQQVSGIDLLALFRFGPSLVFMFTVLAVYVLCRREGYGLEAAFFTCLIPTTVGLMGPSFMVPVALGLAFIPLSLFIAFRVKSWPGYLLLFIVACFLWLLHPPTTAVLYIVIAPYILLNLKADWRRSLGLSIVLIAPLLMALPWIYENVIFFAGRLLNIQPFPTYVDMPALVVTYGFLPLAFFFAGLIYLAKEGNKVERGLVLGLALLTLMGAAALTFHIGIDILYRRSLFSVMLLIGLVAGAGLSWLSKFRLPAQLKVAVPSMPGIPLCFIVATAILIIALPTRLNIPYYRMIDDNDYRAFVWVGANIISDDSCPFMLDPWQGSAFTALSGIRVYQRITARAAMADGLIQGFLNSGCPDSGFLKENKVTFLYNRYPCANTDLDKIRDNVYFVSAGRLSDNLPDKELLQNGSFETLTPILQSSWHRYQQYVKPIFLFPEPGRNGGSCVGIRMSATAPYMPWPLAWWYQNVAIQSGITYITGAWIKTMEVTGEGGAKISVQWLDQGKKVIKAEGLMPYIKGTTDWSYYEYSDRAPVGAASCYVWLELAGCSGTAWFDDVSFKSE